MATCLVTGASGFIGTHLVRTLVARGDHVKCLIRFTAKRAVFEALPIELVYGDLTDFDSLAAAVAGCDYVYHLAGLTKSLKPAELFEVNERGTLHLLAACARAPTPPTVILVSSLAAAGPAIDGKAVEPGEPSRPVSNYGRSKLAGERIARQFSDRVPVTIVRPPIVIGEGDRHSFELFYAIKVYRTHLIPGKRVERYSMVYAADLTAALVSAAEHGKRIVSQEDDGVGLYYVADAETPTYAEIGAMISNALHRQSCFMWYTSKPVVRLFAVFGELAGQLRGRPATLNLDKAREAIAGSWICSPKTAEKELGFQTSVPLAIRFQEIADWYLRQGWM
jgi:nucleoside-diphosphate-sugar epimerase